MSKLNFEAGAAVNDGVWYSSLNRRVGKTLFAKIYPSNTNGIINVGWDINTSGVINDRLVFGAGGIIKIALNGGAEIDVGTYTATSYTVALVMRTNGMFWFIQGGAYTYWTLLLSSLTGSVSGIPAITAGSTSTIFQADDARVPSRLFIPVPLASDSFSGTGLLKDNPTDGLGTPEGGGSGLAWTGDTWSLVGGKAVNTPVLTGSELLVDGGLENWGSPTNLTSWDETIAGTSSVNRESSIVYAGTYSARLDVDLSDSNAQIFQPITFAFPQWVEVSVWAKANVAANLILRDSGQRIGNLTTPLTTDWAQYRSTGRVLASGNNIVLQRGGGSAGASIYLDNVSAKYLSLASLFASLVVSSANCHIYATLNTVPGAQSGIVCNVDSASNPQNFVHAYRDGANINMDKYVAGVPESLISSAVSQTTDEVMKIIKDGTSYRLFCNNVVVGTVQTISDAGIINNTLHGIFSTNSGNTVDNFVCEAIGNEGQYEDTFGA